MIRSGPPPRARRQDVIDVYHGVKVIDPYRWMETASEERERWLKAQDAYTRRVLRGLPGRDRLRDQLRAGNREVERVHLLRIVGDEPRVFALRRGVHDESPRLVVRSGWDGADRVLVDAGGPRGGRPHQTIDSAHPSPDGRYVAYVMSSAGSELGTIEIIEVDSGRVLPDRIERVLQPALISWRPDGRSFFYWRRAASGPRVRPSDWLKGVATYLHVIGGDPDATRPVIGADMPDLGIDSHAVTYVDAIPGSRWALAVAMPDVSKRSFFAAPLARVKPGATKWRRVIEPDEKVTTVVVHQDRIYALTYADAPNFRVISFDAEKETLADAREFVAASDVVLMDLIGARDAMYLVALDRGLHRLFRVAWESGARTEIALPFEGAIGDLVAQPDQPGLVFSMEGWVRRPAWFQVEGTVVRELPVSASRGGAQRFVAERMTAVGRDGVEVPLSIMRREDGPLDGTAPAMLYGYGAYGMSATPMYSTFYLTWVKWGGVYAVCHVRGGGERGKSWHLSGIRGKKENGVDDFITCAEFLIKRRYSASSRLTAFTASAGGLVVGGAITKRPELFAAAVIRVGDLNPLRKEVTEGGPAHVEEYGDVNDKEQFATLYATDPYHRVRDGIDYPAVLLTAGLQDVRVNAWVPAKFAARLQASGSDRPTLLRIDPDDGHGFASTQSQREEEYADIFAFALWQSAGERGRQ